MPNYSLGKIYKIVGGGKVYIGSTTRPLLSQRLAGHNDIYKRWIKSKEHYVTSFECLEDPGHYIELIELCPCSCKDELLKCERKWIREIECVNTVIPDRKRPEWVEENKDKIKERMKTYEVEWREKNREARREYMRAYREKNKEKLNQYKKKWFETQKLVSLGNMEGNVAPSILHPL